MIFWGMFRRKLKERKARKITQRYRTLATVIGAALGDIHLGDSEFNFEGATFNIRDPELYHLLDECEEAYASLGYRLIHLNEWTDYAGWGISIDEKWLALREEDERPIFSKFTIDQLPERSTFLSDFWNSGV